MTTLLLAIFTSAAGCRSSPGGEGNSSSDIEAPGGIVSLSIEGDVSFAGTPEFSTVGELDRGQPIDVEFIRVDSSHTLKVHLLVPSTIYTGVGDYACGTEIGKTPTEYPYCSITIEHWWDQNTLAMWTTESVPISPGVWGALPDCSIQIATDADPIRGTVDCSDFEVVSDAAHPDHDHSVARLRGNWQFLPVTR